jgi:hypothetical protein
MQLRHYVTQELASSKRMPLLAASTFGLTLMHMLQLQLPVHANIVMQFVCVLHGLQFYVLEPT